MMRKCYFKYELILNIYQEYTVLAFMPVQIKMQLLMYGKLT